MIANPAGRPFHFVRSPRMQTVLLWLGAVVLPLIWMWTKWVNPSFGMVDDAADWMDFRRMSADFGGWLTTEGLYGEAANGRFRPMFWLFRFLFYYLPCGENPAAWYAVLYVHLALVLTATFVLIKRLTQSAPCAFLACALWVLNAKTMENFTRLATHEIWQFLWLTFGMLTFHSLLTAPPKKSKGVRYVLLFLFTLFFYFSKETSILLMPVTAVMALASVWFKKNRGPFLIFFGINLLLFAAQRVLSPQLSGYSTAFAFSLQTIADNLRRYPGRIQWVFVFLPLLTFFIWRSLRGLRKNAGAPYLDSAAWWQTAFLALGLVFFVILLPWSQPAPRYLVLTDFFFALFMAIEIRNLFLFLEKKLSAAADRRHVRMAKGTAVAAVLLLAWFSQAEFFVTLQYAAALADKETPVQALELFAQHAKPNANVLYLEVENEIVAAAAIFLHERFGRPDIRLYSFSPYALALREKGFRIIPLTEQDWPSVLEKMDYLYWPRRGSLRGWIDQFHAQLMMQLLESGRRFALRPVYDNLYVPLPGALPEGTQIWQLGPTRLISEDGGAKIPGTGQNESVIT